MVMAPPSIAQDLKSLRLAILHMFRTAVLASEQRITEQFLAANAALLAQLQQPTATPATTDQQQSIPADYRATYRLA
jgi:hypothetical protein